MVFGKSGGNTGEMSWFTWLRPTSSFESPAGPRHASRCNIPARPGFRAWARRRRWLGRGEDFTLAGRFLFNAETLRTQSATPSNSAMQPPLAPLFSAAYRMAKADIQKAKGDIWWQSARAFGQESTPTMWRLARMNPCVSNPKSEIGNPKLNGWGGDRLRGFSLSASNAERAGVRSRKFRTIILKFQPISRI